MKRLGAATRAYAYTGQRGVVLLVTLVFVTVFALMSGAVLRGSDFALRLAANEIARDQLYRYGESIMKELSRDRGHFPLSLTPGEISCGGAVRMAGCTNFVTTPPVFSSVAPPGVVVSYSVRRLYPAVTAGLPPRYCECLVTAIPLAGAALFELQVAVERINGAAGEVLLSRGLLLPLASP
jgi:hypothetical protein